MTISQISTSNTFSQWLTATQSLIDKYNYYESTSNTLFAAANNTVNVYSNTVNVYSNTVNLYNNVVTLQANTFSTNTNVHVTASNVYNTWANVYTANATINGLFVFAPAMADKTNSAYTHANSAHDKANSAYNSANDTYTYANAAFNQANLAFSVANATYDHANSGYILANDAINYSNTALTVGTSAFGHINAAYNTVNSLINTINTANLATITDDVDTDSSFYITLTSNTSGLLRNVSISTTKLYFNPNTGTLNSTNYNSLSDIKLKKDIIQIYDATNTINHLNGVEFKWIENDRKSYGLIAQEIEKIIPELVEGDNQKTVNYIGLIAFLVNAVKELDKRISDLEKKL